MKKQKWIKKLTAVFLTAALAVSMTGCGGGGSKAEDKDIKDLVYNAEVVPGLEEMKGDVNSFYAKDDLIYIFTSEWIENENPSGAVAADGARDADEQAGADDDADADEEGGADDAADADEEAGADDASDADEEDGTDGAGDADEEDAADNEGDVEDDGEADQSNINRTTTTDGEDEVTDTVTIDEDFSVDDETMDYSYTVNQYFYSIKSDGSDFKELFSNLDCGDINEWLNDFCVAGSGDVYMLYNAYDMEEGANTYIIRILDAAGTQKKEIDLTDLITDEDTYFQSMRLDHDDNIYLSSDQTIYVLDPEGNKAFDAKLDNWCNGMANTNKGDVAVSTYADEGTDIKVIDFAAKGFGETYKLDANMYSSNSLIDGAGDYTIYYNDSTSLYGYNGENGKSTELLNWVSSNINASYMNNLQPFSDGKFIGSYYDYSATSSMEEEDGARTELYVMTKVDPSQIKDKDIITYAGTWVSDEIKSMAVKFNKSQDKYQVIVKDYSSSDDPVTDMNADLIAGNIPDIIDMSSVDVEKYVAKGMLTDLYKFMDKDPDINKEDFIENVLAVMETDGKLYHISPTFGINALVGRAEDISGRTSFTIDDVIELEKKYGDGAKAFNSRTNSGILSSFCSSNFDHYIDWTTGKCSFDSDEFIKLLEYANTYPSEDDMDWENTPSLPTSVRERKTIFADVYSMSMEEIELYTGMFQDEISFIGYPSDSSIGTAASLGTDIGIYAKTKYADGAWEFVKNFLTEEYVSGSSSRYFYGALPLRKDALENEIEKYTATEEYTDKYGHTVYPIDSSWGYDDIEVKIGPLTDGQVAKLREVIASVDHVYSYSSEIYEIITEESGAYFSGQKTAKEVADIIQNRVSTYVNENR